jgi:hypothetical protein
MDHILSHMNAVHTPNPTRTDILILSSHLCLGLLTGLVPWDFPTKIPQCTTRQNCQYLADREQDRTPLVSRVQHSDFSNALYTHLPTVCYTSHSAHPWYDHPNNTCWRTQDPRYAIFSGSLSLHLSTQFSKHTKHVQLQFQFTPLVSITRKLILFSYLSLPFCSHNTQCDMSSYLSLSPALHGCIPKCFPTRILLALFL